jgi:hypothetical protein
MDDTPEKPERVDAVELASESFPELGKLLIAGLFRHPDGPAVELGLWMVADGKLFGSPTPMVFMAADTPQVRRVVEAAIGVLPRAEFDEDGIAVLTQEVDPVTGKLVCTATRISDGAGLFSLWWTDGTGVASVPLDKAGALARVLRAAEKQLTEWGVAPLAGDLRN